MKALRHLARRLSGRPEDFREDWTAPEKGRWGERWAAWHYYRRRGAAILARNWSGGGGELDLVVREGQVLVFVEVKTRDPDDPEPLSAVRDEKRKRRFRAAASAFLGTLPPPRPGYRFDALLVTPRGGDPGEPQIDCLVDVLSESEDG